MTESAYTYAKSRLLEERADNAKTTRENILTDRTILRVWREIPIKHVQECLDFLGKYTSVKNAKETHSVTDPMVNREPVPGKWHHVQEYALPPRPETEPDVHDVYQFLQLGWVTSPDQLPTPRLLTDDKALLSPFAHDVTSVKNAYVWEYRWIDPAYAQSLRNTIALASGVIAAKVIKGDDGSCSIQALTQTNTWEGTLSQVWEKETQHPTFAAEKIVNTYSHIPLTSLDAFKTTLGTATTGYKVASLLDSTDEDRGFAKIIQTQEKLFPDTVSADNGTLTEEEYLQLLTGGVLRTTMWLNVPDADLVTAMATVATAPTGYSVLRVANNYDGTGSFNLIRVMMLTATSPATATQMKIEFPTFDDERRTYFYFGLDKTTADATYILAQTTCDEGFKVDMVEIQEWRYNTLVVIQQISKINVALTGQVRAYDYTRAFGLVNVATTIYLNVAKASIAVLKTTILADTAIIVLNLSDDDVGQGKANLTCIWRSKEAAPRSLGAVRATKESQFHKTEEDRLWIDVNIEDTTSLDTAVAAALAGTDPYPIAAGEEVREVTGEDAGDKTARLRQRIVKAGETDTAADYSLQESFNPHGLREAVMVISVREYPEVSYSNVATIFTALQAYLGTPAKGRIQVSLNPGKGTFSMRALKEGTPDWDNTVPVYVKMAVQNRGLIGEKKTEVATGVPVADAAAIVEAATAETDHVIDEIRMIERDHGEAAIEKKQLKKYETEVQVSETAGLGLRRATKNYTWPLVMADNVAAIWAEALTAGVAGDYVLLYRQKQILGNGMFLITNEVAECTEKKLNYTSGYLDDAIIEIEECQDAASMPVITDTEGADITLKGSWNLYGKYDYVKTTITSRIPRSCASQISWNVYGAYFTTEQYSLHIGTLDPDKYMGGHSYYWHSATNQWQIMEIHTLAFFTTAAAAALAATGGREGSAPYRLSNNLWMARKVTRSDVFIGQVTYENPHEDE